MTAFIVIGLVICMLFFLEWIYRRGYVHAEYTRKLAHVLACIIAAVSSQILTRDVFIVINIFFVLVFLYIRWKKALGSIEGVDRFTFGSVCLPLGFIVLGIFLYGRMNEILIGLTIVGISDTSAGFIRYRYNLSKGNLITFFTVWFLSFTFSRFTFGNFQSILIASSVALVEYFSGYGIDNLSIPLVYVALVMFF